MFQSSVGLPAAKSGCRLSARQCVVALSAFIVTWAYEGCRRWDYKCEHGVSKKTVSQKEKANQPKKKARFPFRGERK